MTFWEKIEKDLKKNLKDGLELFKEGSATVSHKIELLTEEGKRKYKIFNLNTKVQDEFTKLGGLIYDLTNKKTKKPLVNKNVSAVIKKIKKIENQITKLEHKDKPKSSTKRKKSKKKTTKKKTSKK